MPPQKAIIWEQLEETFELPPEVERLTIWLFPTAWWREGGSKSRLEYRYEKNGKGYEERKPIADTNSMLKRLFDGMEIDIEMCYSVVFDIEKTGEVRLQISAMPSAFNADRNLEWFADLKLVTEQKA